MPTPRWMNILILALLIAIGVLGRLGQPDWCMTPIAAVGLAAGWWFRSSLLAMVAPLGAMLLSDLALPSYGHLGIAVVVYVALAWPVLLGKWISRSTGISQTALRWATGALIPALVFFIAVNFAVWALSTNYEPNFAGLVQCYTAAIPFLKKMLLGDLFYAGSLATALLAAGLLAPSANAQRAG